MSRPFGALGSAAASPFLLLWRLAAYLFTGAVGLVRHAAVLLAEFGVGILAVIVPLVVFVLLLFGLFYLLSMVMDGLWL